MTFADSLGFYSKRILLVESIGFGIVSVIYRNDNIVIWKLKNTISIRLYVG